MNWDSKFGISPSNNREHLIYIDRLCKQVKEQFLKSWDFLFSKKRSLKEERKIDFLNEIKQHRLFFSKRCV